MRQSLTPKRFGGAGVIAGVATLMLVEAVSLGVASTLHLAGLVHGRGGNFNPDAAGTAEAIIGVVLAAAAVFMWRRPGPARTIGIAANGFALVGFLVGISETASGGDIPDITYHATVIPLLVAGLVLLIRSRPTS
jgi:hypothetical protein